MQLNKKTHATIQNQIQPESNARAHVIERRAHINTKIFLFTTGQNSSQTQQKRKNACS